jgi:tetratricopeptide (TPR) repeat protein
MKRAAGFDEDAVTVRLTAVRRRDQLFAAPRVRFAAAIGIATFAAAIVSFAGDSDVAGSKTALSVIPWSVPVAAPAVEPVLASGTIVLPDIREDPDEGIIILDDEPEAERIVILDDPPVRRSWRASGRARAREAAGALMRQAETSRRAGDNATAKRHLAAALAASPAYAPAAAALAEIHIEQRRYGAAIRYAKRAARSAPDELDYKLLLGDAYDLGKHRSAARKVWREASAHGSAIAAARLQR